jgi:hypothetical protein
VISSHTHIEVLYMLIPELEQLTRKTFSRPSIVLIDDEPHVVGKFCNASYLGDDKWDVWVHNPKDIPAGLSNRKVTNIQAAVQEACKDCGPFRRLEGEGVFLAMPTHCLITVHRVLGIKARQKHGGRPDWYKGMTHE